jgi:hypothetical protein
VWGAVDLMVAAVTGNALLSFVAFLPLVAQSLWRLTLAIREARRGRRCEAA